MAKKQRVSKTQAVRDYLKAHPGAMSGKIAAALNKQGIKIKPSHVANIKSTLNRARRAKKAAKTQAPAQPTAPVAAKKPAKAADAITLEQIKAVAQTVKAVGGYDRLTAILGLVREVGGLKKFKDLVDAIMSARE